MKRIHRISFARLFSTGIILAFLRCSLQSLGEYLKRPDQSASGQFHQHLNTCLLFLREPALSFLFLPFALSLLFSPAFSDLPKQLPALWIFLRAGYRWKTRWARRDERVGKFSKVLAETRSVKETRADNAVFQKTFCLIQRSFRRKLANF